MPRTIALRSGAIQTQWYSYMGRQAFADLKGRKALQKSNDAPRSYSNTFLSARHSTRPKQFSVLPAQTSALDRALTEVRCRSQTESLLEMFWVLEGLSSCR